jgi:hypothetical protein
LLTVLGVVLAIGIKEHVRLTEQTYLALTLVAVGSALAAAANGAFRTSGRSTRFKWLAAGAGAGILVAVLA